MLKRMRLITFEVEGSISMIWSPVGAVMRTTRIPFGAFLCPALWIVFFADSVTR